MTSLDEFDVFAEGLNHSEGVVWNPLDGNIYAGGETGELFRVTLAGKVEELATSGGSMLGLAVDGDGRVYACDEGLGRIARLDPATGELGVYGTDREDPLDTPNVAAFDGSGNLYVTCSGEEGRPEIVRIGRSGTIETWTTEVPGYPNGCVVLPDESALLVVEATARRVVHVPIEADGSAGSVQTFAELPDTDMDGLALDAEGFLWATVYRPDGLVRFTPDGSIDERIDDHLATTMNSPTNLAFYGDRLDRAVVAHIGSRTLLDVDLGVRGQPLFYPRIDA